MEFEESEVIFSDYSSDQSNESETTINCGNNVFRMVNKMNNNMKKKKKKQGRIISTSCNSLPMNIIIGNGSYGYDMDMSGSDPFVFDYSIDVDKDEDPTLRLAPHVIVERRVNREMARSFSPLKGKHLCEVRNSILRMTGFLER